MNTLNKVLEEARALQLRYGSSLRETLALAMANQRRLARMADAIRHHGNGEVTPMQMPAASCLDALLPRDRDPSVEEIRAAWNECIKRATVSRRAEWYEELVVMSTKPLQGNQ